VNVAAGSDLNILKRHSAKGQQKKDQCRDNKYGVPQLIKQLKAKD
jgi:hypothetical protein